MNLDQRLDSLSELAAKHPKPEVFFTALAEALISSVEKGIAAAVWSVENGGFRLQAEIGLQKFGLSRDADIRSLHEGAIEEACRSEHGTVAIKTPDGQFELIFNTSRFEGNCFLVLELIYPSPNECSEWNPLPLLLAFNEAARDYRNQLIISELRLRDELFTRLNQYLPRWYGNNDLRHVSYCVANDLTEVAKVDRVSIGVFENDKVEVQAVSGLMAIERRAKQITKLETLLCVSARAGLEIRSPIQSELPPVCMLALEDYIDASGNESILILPSNLHEDSGRHPQGTAVILIAFENFKIGNPIDISSCRETIKHAERALHEAVNRKGGAALRVGRIVDRTIKSLFQNRLKTISAVALVFGLLAAICAIPVRNDVAAEGYLEYSNTKDVFAPLDAEVVALGIAHGMEVRKGDSLVVLRSRSLELKREEILTQRDVAMEKHRSIEASRLLERRSKNQESTVTDWAAAEKEYREMIAGQEEQLWTINEMMETLKITSPIDGVVLSWTNSKDWLTRPVRQGQKLASVVDPRSAEIVRLKLRDIDAQSLQRELNSGGETLIRFTLVSNPVDSFQAVVSRTSLNADRTDPSVGYIQVEATVLPDQEIPPSPGASVRGRIDCGQTTLGYNWARRLLNQWRLWWYF